MTTEAGTVERREVANAAGKFTSPHLHMLTRLQ